MTDLEQSVPVSALVAVLLGLGLAGCGAARTGDVVPRGSTTLAQARALDEFPLFYAGERVLGHPLVTILRRQGTARYVSFVYGHCEPVALEGGCAPPVEIQVWPVGERDLGSYAPAARGSPPAEPTTVRGLPAAQVGDGQLEIDAGGSTVVVFSASREQGRAVAAALRCVTDAATAKPFGALGC